MRVLTLKTQTLKIPGYPKYTTNFKYYFNGASGVYGENGTPNANYANIYIYLYINYMEISIDMNRECARFARSIIGNAPT